MTSQAHNLVDAPKTTRGNEALIRRPTVEDKARSLPAQFHELETFVSTWALATQQERNDKRVASTMAELQQFYASLVARIKEIAVYLDQFPINALPNDAVNLLHLGQMLMEIAPAVEVMNSPDIPSAYARERLIIHPQMDQFRKT